MNEGVRYMSPFSDDKKHARMLLFERVFDDEGDKCYYFL